MTDLRRGATLSLVAISVVTTGCGYPPPTATPLGVTITLTDGGCRDEGLGALLPAHFTATLVNDTSAPFMLGMQRLLEGHAFRELELHIEEQQRRYAAGMDSLGTPTFTFVILRTEVEPRQRKGLDTKLVSGIYGMVCRRRPTSTTIEAVYLLGPFRVP